MAPPPPAAALGDPTGADTANELGSPAPTHSNPTSLSAPGTPGRGPPSPRPNGQASSTSVAYDSATAERREKHPMSNGKLGFLDGSSNEHLPLPSTISNLASNGTPSRPRSPDLSQGQYGSPGHDMSPHRSPPNYGPPLHIPGSNHAHDSDRDSSVGWSPAGHWSPAFSQGSMHNSPNPGQFTPQTPYESTMSEGPGGRERSSSWNQFGPPPYPNGSGVGLGVDFDEKRGYDTFPLSGQGEPFNHPTARSRSPWSWEGLQDSTAYWLALYFVFNLGLTIYNKIVLNGFPFPYTLTGLHALSGCAGCYIALERGAFVPARLTSRENVILAAFSVLYTINIAVSSLSLGLVTVAFHQVVRASTPLFTILVAAVILRTKVSTLKVVSLLPVIAGIGLATYGDYYFTAWGLILTLLGTFLAALKTVVTNIIQTGGGGRLKLHPLDLLMRMSPLAFIQCVIYGWWTGELERVRKYGATQMTRPKAIALLVNGMLACGLNIVSFTANKKAGPLTMTVSANCKQVMTLVLAGLLFDLHLNFTNLVGIGLTLIGGGWYGWVEYQEKRKKTIRLSEKT